MSQVVYSYNNLKLTNKIRAIIAGLVIIASYISLMLFTNGQVADKYYLSLNLLFIIFYLAIYNRSIYCADTIIIYIALLALLALVNSFYKSSYSSLRFIFSIVNLYIYLIFWRSVFINIIEGKFGSILTVALNAFLVTLMIFQLLVPNWASGEGGIRFSGGINPNTIAVFSLMCFVVSTATAISLHERGLLKYSSVPIVAIFWSMSRSVLLSILVFFVFCIIPYLYMKGIVRFATISLFGVIVVFSGVFMFSLFDYGLFDFILMRISNARSVETRMAAWNLLLEYFYLEPLFGGLGWWEGSRILSNVAEELNSEREIIAASPHNLYVRLLAETGLIGLAVIISYPVLMIFSLFWKIRSRYLVECVKMKMLLFFSSVFIVCFLVREFFEDTYLVGAFDLSNFCFISCLGFASAVLSRYRVIANSRRMG